MAKKPSKKETEKVLVLVHSTVEQTCDAAVDKGTTLNQFIRGMIDDGKLPVKDAGCIEAVVDGVGGESAAPNRKLVQGDIVRIAAKTANLDNIDREFERKLELYSEGKLDPETDGGFSSRISLLTPELIAKLASADAALGQIDDEDVEEERDCDGCPGCGGYGVDCDDPACVDCEGCPGDGCDVDTDAIEDATDLLMDLLTQRGTSTGELTVRVEDGRPVVFKLTYK